MKLVGTISCWVSQIQQLQVAKSVRKLEHVTLYVQLMLMLYNMGHMMHKCDCEPQVYGE